MEQPDTLDDAPKPPVIITESWVDLKLRAFRAEVRLLVVISLLANQFFAHVTIPASLTAVSATGLGALLLGAKLFIGRG